MEIRLKAVKSILTPQKGGLLIAGAYPFTHTLSAYVGCGFGQTTCGLYCYAPFLPNWSFSGLSEPWGKAILVKENASEALEQMLSRMKPAARQKLRIFMSSTTDPYQPIERRYQLTRRCLEVFSRYPDLDLLLVQTRSPLAGRDLDLLQHIPFPGSQSPLKQTINHTSKACAAARHSKSAGSLFVSQAKQGYIPR